MSLSFQIEVNVSHIVLVKFWPTLLHNVTVIHWGLQAFMRNSLKVLLHNFNQADIWALTGLLQVFFSAIML